jgi:methylated-DNA-protein-cysteine methyltransferase-like protein
MRFFELVYRLVSCIPPGRVTSYGQIARLLDHPHAARTVGWALGGVREGSDVPWHRVINAAGRISIPDPQGAAKQRCLLEAEGVVFDPDGYIDLDRFGWVGPDAHEIQALMVRMEGNDDQK